MRRLFWAAGASWLHTTRRSLDALDDRALNANEQVDRRILQGIVDGWLLDLETVRTWTRNPMVYVAAISDGLHDLATMESAPPQVRVQHVITKLHGVPSLLTSARANIKAPPRIFVERAIAMLGGVTDLLSHDLPLAFAAVHNESLVARLKQIHS